MHVCMCAVQAHTCTRLVHICVNGSLSSLLKTWLYTFITPWATIFFSSHLLRKSVKSDWFKKTHSKSSFRKQFQIEGRFASVISSMWYTLLNPFFFLPPLFSAITTGFVEVVDEAVAELFFSSRKQMMQLKLGQLTVRQRENSPNYSLPNICSTIKINSSGKFYSASLLFCTLYVLLQVHIWKIKFLKWVLYLFNTTKEKMKRIYANWYGQKSNVLCMICIAYFYVANVEML